jgi:homocysteine S-methyltransferase
MPRDGEAAPSGIGINCTNPAFLPALAADFTSAVQDLRRSGRLDIQPKREHEGLSNATSGSGPTSDTRASQALQTSFVLYPDGGQIYDTLTRSWSKDKLSPGEWTQRIMEVVHDVERAEMPVRGASSGSEGGCGEKVWKEVIVGGCCKTSFGEIAVLREAVDQYLEKGFEAQA